MGLHEIRSEGYAVARQFDQSVAKFRIKRTQAFIFRHSSIQIMFSLSVIDVDLRPRWCHENHRLISVLRTQGQNAIFFIFAG